MNEYFKKLSKIEFVVTYACSGRCKHCSEGDHQRVGERIDPEIATDAVRKICEKYEIRTVMAFGGEPLLYTDAVESIMRAATELAVPHRQLITNGYFSQDPDRIKSIAERISLWGVNDLLLSADAFHQQTIPLETVMLFARRLKEFGVPVRIQPAWLVSKTDKNKYNEKTREILLDFANMGIDSNEGNVIFPEGNALKYLAEYFIENVPKNPYTEDPCDVKCISIEPNGAVLDGNLYRESITDIMDRYSPKRVERK